MSFFKKIFGADKADAVSRHKLISREPRIALSEHHRIMFTSAKPVFDKAVRLANISSKGLAIVRADAPRLTVGDELEGRLRIEAVDFEIAASVRHLTERIVGCAILADNPELRRAIESYLRVEILGMKLSKVDPAYLKPDPRGQVVWFTDGRHNEVYAVVDASGILDFHLTFLGNYVAGGRLKPLVCGYVKEDNEKDVPGHKSSALIDSSGAPTNDMLALASVLIQNVDKMPVDLQDEFKKALVQAQP